MCGVCGCSTQHHAHDHGHDHSHEKMHLINIEEDIFANNNRLAKVNEKHFSDRGILAINIMSSPGSGKTTLLSKTVADLKSEIDMAVIVGDQDTSLDAEIIKSSGGNVCQLNTGKTCHLDAHMISHALEDISIKDNAILFIENIGNLVCPASFHLGEKIRIVILSVTEGDNKPLKYPEMFRSADLMIITKSDLLPHVDFKLSTCEENARKINPHIKSMVLSAKTGDGLTDWYHWLRKMHN